MKEMVTVYITSQHVMSSCQLLHAECFVPSISYRPQPVYVLRHLNTCYKQLWSFVS